MHVIPKKRGRGRPRSFDIDAALDRAVEVFWKNGYEGADLSALTEASFAGLAKARLMNHSEGTVTAASANCNR